MSQTPRTPRARDNESLDPSQNADDAHGANADLYGDENVAPAGDQGPPSTVKHKLGSPRQRVGCPVGREKTELTIEL